MSQPIRQHRTPSRRLKRVAAAPLVFVAAVIILFEDWFWDDLARLGAAIGRLPLLLQIESLIAALPSYGALACFAVPSSLLIPVKLLALHLIASGRPLLGLLTVVTAKVGGTALVARIFVLTRPKLMRIGWFAWLHERLIAFKSRIHERIASTALYRAAHELISQMRGRLRTWTGRSGRLQRRRLIAIFGLLRRRKNAAV